MARLQAEVRRTRLREGVLERQQRLALRPRPYRDLDADAGALRRFVELAKISLGADEAADDQPIRTS